MQRNVDGVKAKTLSFDPFFQMVLLTKLENSLLSGRIHLSMSVSYSTLSD
jgi:hypothetical protein